MNIKFDISAKAVEGDSRSLEVTYTPESDKLNPVTTIVNIPPLNTEEDLKDHILAYAPTYEWLSILNGDSVDELIASAVGKTLTIEIDENGSVIPEEEDEEVDDMPVGEIGEKNTVDDDKSSFPNEL